MPETIGETVARTQRESKAAKIVADVQSREPDKTAAAQSEPEKEPVEAKPAAPAKEPAAKEPEQKEPDKAPEPKSEADSVFGTEKKEEPVKEPESDDETKGMTPKAKGKWIELRASEKAARTAESAARTELEAMQARVKELESKAGDDVVAAMRKELDGYREREQRYENELSISRVEASREYMEKVGKPMDDVRSSVTDLAKKYEVEPRLLLAALAEGRDTRADRIAEIADGWREADRTELTLLARDHDRLAKEGDALRERAKGKADELSKAEEAETAKARDERLGVYRQAATATWQKRAEALPFLKPNADTPEWTAAVQAALAESVEFNVMEASADDIGKLVADAKTLPFVVKAYEHFKAKQEADAKASQEQIATLEERLARYEKTEPGAGGKTEEPADEPEESGLSIGKMVMKRFKGR